MKKKIFAVLLAVLMLVPALAGFAGAKDYITDKFENPEAKLENMIVSAVSPDKNIYLYFDEFSGELAVKNQATGEILLSNPYDITDRIKDEGLKAQFLSQIYINYRAIGASQSSTYYSYTDCVTYNQLKIVDHYANGILVEYTLGDSRTELLVPLKMTVEDYEALYNKLNYEAQRYFNLHYEKIDPYGKDKYGDDHLPEIRDKWLRQYPISATTPLYVIKPTSLSAPKTVQNIINYVEAQTDYTYEQLLIDYEKVKESTDTFTFGEKANFKFNVKYTVENDGFSAEFDAGSLEYNKEKYYIETVALLPYFGAANRANTGYTFVPDGSGALVRFEDLVAMNRRDTLTVRLYGTDFALYQISERNLEARTMPVFGLINTSGAHAKGFFAIIEDGEALATVLSTHTEQYHNIFSTFKLVSTDTYDLADALSSGISSSKLVGVKADPEDYYDGKCKVKYAMLSNHEASNSAEASYIGMAKYYRDYLTAKGDISKLQAEQINDFTRLFLEVFGAIQVEEKILTFPVNVSKPLTTFDNVIDIHKDLSGNGVGNMSFILKGFANGGLDSVYPTYVKWEKKLGGADGIDRLLTYMNGVNDGSTVAPEFDFTYSQKLKTFSGFKYTETGVKTLDNRYSTKRQYNAATQMFERTGGVAISSGSFALAFEKFYEDMADYDLKHIMLSTLGSDVNSDLDRKGKFYDREDSKDNVVNMLQGFKDKKYNIILNAGNSFTLKYTDAIVGSSLDSSRFNLQSEAVPFYGMVLHGSIEFAGNAINMDGDRDYMFLKALENGASLYFTLTYQNGEYLKFDKTYNKYYSLNYEQLRDDIINMYAEYNELMKDKQDKVIISHRFLNTSYGYNVSRKDGQTAEKVAIDDSSVSFVLYGNDGDTTGEGFLLNYNAFRTFVVDSQGNEISIEPFSYVHVIADKNASTITEIKE